MVAEDRFGGRSPELSSPSSHQRGNLVAEAGGDHSDAAALRAQRLAAIAADVRARAAAIPDAAETSMLSELAEGLEAGSDDSGRHESLRPPLDWSDPLGPASLTATGRSAVRLYVSARGLTTSLMPHPTGPGFQTTSTSLTTASTSRPSRANADRSTSALAPWGSSTPPRCPSSTSSAWQPTSGRCRSRSPALSPSRTTGSTPATTPRRCGDSGSRS